MGQGVGASLMARGLRTVTSLEGRSERTKGLAIDAGFEVLPTLTSVVEEADLILAILPPDQAKVIAADVAKAMTETNAKPVYADCNAVSPNTAHEVSQIIIGAGANFVDCGIVGPSPRKAPPTRFYVSGPDCTAMDVMDGPMISVRHVGDEFGSASALKMCYAALTKGTWTLQAALLTAAARLGVEAPLYAEFADSQPNALQTMQSVIPRTPLDAGRWIGEMEEIAATFAAAGVTPKFHEGSAEMFRLLDQTPFASETRETLDANRTVEETIAELAKLVGDDD